MNRVLNSDRRHFLKDSILPAVLTMAPSPQVRKRLSPRGPLLVSDFLRDSVL